MPIAPPAALVAGIASQPVGGLAQVIPPAPKLVTRSAGAIVLPAGGFNTGGGFTTRNASIATDMRVNSGFGYRSDPFSGRGRMHTGVDFHATYGETVGASMAGTVSFAGVKRGYGNVIVVDHGNGISTYYAHLSTIGVTVGQAVEAGQVIGQIGSTGRSTAPHLHYEVRADGHPLNPFSTLALENGAVFVDGKPMVAPVVDGWGDEPMARSATPAASTTPAGARPRRAAAPAQHTLVEDGDSLTEY